MVRCKKVKVPSMEELRARAEKINVGHRFFAGLPHEIVEALEPLAAREVSCREITEACMTVVTNYVIGGIDCSDQVNRFTAVWTEICEIIHQLLGGTT